MTDVPEATCPNADNPVLCKIHDGVLVPEAGCPLHDPTPVESPMDICECGHTRGGHHRLCNGRAGKFWCNCRQFALLRQAVAK